MGGHIVVTKMDDVAIVAMVLFMVATGIAMWYGHPDEYDLYAAEVLWLMEHPERTR